MLDLLKRWHALDEAAAEGNPEHVQKSHAALAEIAATDAVTLRGALAKLRVGYPADIVEGMMAEALPLEVVGAAGLRDLFKVTATA